jgi:hypothetical protein
MAFRDFGYRIYLYRQCYQIKNRHFKSRWSCPILEDDDFILWESNSIINEQLKKSQYIASDKFTIADIVISVSLNRWYLSIGDALCRFLF